MHDIVVLSDLHIGRGKNPETGRFHNLETFFYDDDLREFLRWAVNDARGRGTRIRLVFNGDTFDLLRTEATPEREASWREQHFGADPTPPVAAQLVAAILAGHPVFVEAVTDVLAHGSKVVFLPGNHDIEVQWKPVQDAIRQAVRERLLARRADVDEALSRLTFESWFVFEPGRIWIEHGCQYDSENAFRHFLRGRLAEEKFDAGLLELDLPLGNFFQRYLYNAFGPLTFMVPSTRANARYSRWLLLHEPRLLFRVIWSHLPFIWQLIRRLARKRSRERMILADAHRAELRDLSKSSGLGKTLEHIERLKMVRGDLLQAAREYSLQALRALSIAGAIALAGAGLWFTGFYAINAIHFGFGAKALLFLALNVLLLAAFGAAMAWALVRPSPPMSPRPQRRAAQEIVKLLDVPAVTFGHTHEEALWRLDRPWGGKAWLFNTGTWVAVFTQDEFLPRERVQLTFLRMIGHEAELLYWSPGRGEPLPVILLDEMDSESVAAVAEPSG